MKLKTEAQHRSVNEVGPGDYIKNLDNQFEKIISNTAYKVIPLPKTWTIKTEGQGGRAIYTMWQINAYYKAEDFEGIVSWGNQNVIDNAAFIIQRAANEPCHRSDYGWNGTCQYDGGHDSHYKCASCLARDFLGLAPR